MKEISSIIPPSRRDCKFSTIASWRDFTELNRQSRSFGASIELTVGRLLLTLPFALYLKTHKHTHTTETLVWCVCARRRQRTSIRLSTFRHSTRLSVYTRILFIYYNASVSCLILQLILKSKATSPITLYFLMLRGPFGEMQVQPKIYHFEFTESTCESPLVAFPVILRHNLFFIKLPIYS